MTDCGTLEGLVSSVQQRMPKITLEGTDRLACTTASRSGFRAAPGAPVA